MNAAKQDQYKNVTLYDWVPFFQEISKKFVEIGKQSPEKRDADMQRYASEVFGKDATILKFLPVNPLSFIYTLAIKSGSGNAKGKNLFENAKKVFGIHINIPTDWTFPMGDARSAIFEATSSPNLDNLWSLFTTAATASKYSDLNNELFIKCIAIKSIKIPKLSQVLHLINPHCYLPLDTNASLPALNKWQPTEWDLNEITKKIKKEEYTLHDILGKIYQYFPGCMPYEINRFSYLYTSDQLKINNRFFQIDLAIKDNNDGTENQVYPQEELRKKSCVWIDATEANIDSYPLSKPQEGDIMLVRTGETRGRAIGIVQHNDYCAVPETHNDNPKIQLIFMNFPEDAVSLVKEIPDDEPRMELASEATLQAFRNIPAFADTMNLIAALQHKKPKTELVKPNKQKNTILYDWIPFFKEINEKLFEIGKNEEERDEKIKQCVRNIFGDKEAEKEPMFDPYSLIYKIVYYSYNDRAPITIKTINHLYEKIKKDFDISAEIPTDWTFSIPKFNREFLFDKPSSVDTNHLWSLFNHTIRIHNYKELKEELISVFLKVHGIGAVTLSKLLFVINPDFFSPLGKHTALQILHEWRPKRWNSDEQLISVTDKNELLHIMDKIHEKFPGCKPYEINRFAYPLCNAKSDLRITNSYFQIDIGVNNSNDGKDMPTALIKSFKERGGVWMAEAELNKHADLLRKPQNGDIMLLRVGHRYGCAIGIVFSNGYNTDPNEYDGNQKIQLIFINFYEKPINLAVQISRSEDKIGEASEMVLRAFRNTREFKDTMDLIEKRQSRTPQNLSHASLNRIFYGPPGTGKTYKTLNAALEIIDPKFYKEHGDEKNLDKNRDKLQERFGELQEQGQIEAVTFHQSFGYEEFVEGIRPVMGQAAGGNISYEIRKGVFKKLCERAETEQNKRFVLIIDEINRGNISRIFGELISLIEESKRLNKTEELKITLAYSEDPFGVPHNLYIIGTMNTADRSIALLDTALRRRFRFEEMMPDSELLKDIEVEGVKIAALLDAINERIWALYDRDHQIGHSYFMRLKKEENSNMETLKDIFQHEILPLLEEYFYDDWEKIDLVLNKNGFLKTQELPAIPNNNVLDTDKKLWMINNEQEVFDKPANYQQIYNNEQNNNSA